MNRSLTQIINYKGFCRTAPVTPGLLIILKKNKFVLIIDMITVLKEIFGLIIDLKIALKIQNWVAELT